MGLYWIGVILVCSGCGLDYEVYTSVISYHTRCSPHKKRNKIVFTHTPSKSPHTPLLPARHNSVGTQAPQLVCICGCTAVRTRTNTENSTCTY